MSAHVHTRPCWFHPYTFADAVLVCDQQERRAAEQAADSGDVEAENINGGAMAPQAVR